MLLFEFRSVACWTALTLLWSWSTVKVNAVERSYAGAAEPKTDPAIYGEGVRTTPWQSPEQERSGFHLPPGFEVRLFASEPQIAKPLNMAFDSKGQLWLTQSTTYPYAAESGSSPQDAVMILSDNDGDGHAESIRQFAGDLNIPMGLLPYGDGCLVFSIPNLLYLRDTDGDGVCDKRDVVLGPFDTSRDTHGMINALRDGHDGWIYACHGFNNRSEVTGADGHTIRMQSGNTFRFRPDGSRVELVTQGQVNPFGMTEDDWGYRYSADCHSKPITQLIPDACYPSFGRPHDGLGFLPPMIDHLHGSTAISGIQYLSPHSEIVPLRGQMISGNVMTSRINRNRVSYLGATAVGDELPDFLTSDDPWFRPVDIQHGPDGNLYVADFYNRIIGHYEVPLTHPGRDRTSGRIWQIRYSAQPTDGELSETTDADASSVADHLKQLGSESLVDIHRFQTLQPKRKIAWLRVGADRGGVPAFRQLCHNSLRDQNPHVARAAAESLGRLETHDADHLLNDVELLLNRLSSVDPTDVVLRQSLRIAVRNRIRQLSGDAVWQQLETTLVDSPQANEFASILLALPNHRASTWLLTYLQSSNNHASSDADERETLVRHASKHASLDLQDACVKVAKTMAGPSLDRQAELVDLIAGDLNQPSEALSGWALEIATRSLATFVKTPDSAPVVGWTDDRGLTWPSQPRPRPSGQSAELASSHPLGERHTGVYRSDAFPAPPSLSFWIAGHNGPPGKPDLQQNYVRLVSESNSAELFRASPPRSDTATQVNWDTSRVEGTPVRLEIVDGDDGKAYAWLAVGQVSPEWVQFGETWQKLSLATRLIKQYELDDLASMVLQIASDERLSVKRKLALAGALPSVRATAELRALTNMALQADLPAELNASILDCAMGKQTLDVGLAKQTASFLLIDGQRTFARIWTGEGASLDTLIDLCASGSIAPSVLADSKIAPVLSARANAQQNIRIESLTLRSGPTDQKQTQRLNQLAKNIATYSGDRTTGQQLYKKHCIACHQLRGEGAVVGPQLDGAVARTPQRLLQDILTPNQNVDEAFHMVSLLLDDGRVIVGSIQAEDSKVVRVADQLGKSTDIPIDTIEVRKPSRQSLMPSNFGDLLSDQDFADMIAFIKASVR
ncbi:MAG: PVC-type heme-binding CxxCH protein [Planctomycetota bacterium]